MKTGKEKRLVLALCIAGILAIFYGMHLKNNPVFVLGILLVVAGYLLIRKRLKDHIDTEQKDRADENRTDRI